MPGGKRKVAKAKSATSTARKQRLAEALRANLARRKQQARARENTGGAESMVKPREPRPLTDDQG